MSLEAYQTVLKSSNNHELDRARSRLEVANIDYIVEYLPELTSRKEQSRVPADAVLHALPLQSCLMVHVSQLQKACRLLGAPIVTAQQKKENF